MGDFRKLKVWEKAHELALEIYRVTAAFPPEERFGLTSQLRLSAASVPTNLAEGSGRNSQKELARFCRISLGSANELESQLILARDLHYLDAQVCDELISRVDHIRRILARLDLAVART
jgi:four helix bundle protein